MNRSFGDLIKMHLNRKHGLSQGKLAKGINCDPSLVSRMCKGQRLSTPSSRQYIIEMIRWFLDQGVIYNIEEADSLLEAADAASLKDNRPGEAELIKKLRGQYQTTNKISIKNPTDNTVRNHHPNSNLPYPFYSQFVGREVELEKIIRYIKPGAEAEKYIYPVCIDGIGGIGKSSLALTVGYHFYNSYNGENFENIIWISAKEEWFQPTGKARKSIRVVRTLFEILREISITLGFFDQIEFRPVDDWVDIVYQHLRITQTLLIIDNLETIDDDSVISFIQEIPPPTKAIITSRRRIDIAYSIRLEEMKKEDAISLMENLLDYPLEHSTKEKLYERTGGMPLALEWSVGQINLGVNVDVLVKRLSTSQIKDIAKYCFEQSLTAIKETPAYYLLCALAFFNSGANRNIMGVLAGYEGDDEFTRDDEIIKLEKLSLITRHGSVFTMLPLTRSYVKTILHEDLQTKHKIYRCLVDWIRELATSKKEVDEIEIDFDDEHDVLLSAGHYCLERGDFSSVREILLFASNNCSQYDSSEWSNLSERLQAESSRVPKVTKFDFGDAPKIDVFLGRDDEIQTIRDWIILEECKLACLVGFGGIGKSSLAIQIAENIQHNFDFVVWRSLANGPLPNELFLQLLQILIETPADQIPEDVNDKTDLLIKCLCDKKCLVVLDNFETVLKKDNTDSLLDGYEIYDLFIKKWSKFGTRSCVVITSREKPLFISNLENNNSKIRSLELSGLKTTDVKLLLDKEQIQYDDSFLAILTHKYSGNPLAIKWAAVYLSDGNFNNGSLGVSKKIPRDITNLIKEQIEHLTESERELLTWLAIEREPTHISTLQNNIISSSTPLNIEGITEKLARRSLVTIKNDLITLQPILLDYLTHELILAITDELLLEELENFYNFPLLKAQAKDHIRVAQKLFILEPIVQSLVAALGSNQNFIKKLNSILALARVLPKAKQGYALGNIINLFAHVDHDLSNYDFSSTTVNQAFLQSTKLHNVSFTKSHFSNTVFSEVFDIVLSSAFNRTKSMIATGVVSGEILIWDSFASKQIKVLQGHNGWVRSVAFHPAKNNILASGAGDHTVRIWNIETGEVQILTGHTDWVRSVAFNQDGSILASAGSDGVIILWDTSSGKLLKTLRGHTNWIWSVCFSFNGDKLVSGSDDKTIRVWDVLSGIEKNLFEQNDRIRAVAYSPVEDIIAFGGRDSLVRILNEKTGELIHTLEGHRDRVWTLKFSPDGKFLFSGSKDKKIIVWNLKRGSIEKILSGHNGHVISIDCDASGSTLLSGSEDQSIRLWDIKTGQCTRYIQGQSNNVNAISFSSANGFLATGGADSQVRIWDIRTRKCKHTLLGHTNRVKTLSFSNDGKFLGSGSDDKTIMIWDTNTGTQNQLLRGHNGWVLSLAFSPDDKTIASGSDDYSIRIWDLSNGKVVHELQGMAYIHAVVFSPDGSVLASAGADKKIRLWETRTGKIKNILEGHTQRINTLTFISDKLIASGDDDGVVRLWSTNNGGYTVLAKHQGPVRSICYNSNNDSLITCSKDKTARVWSLEGDQLGVINNDAGYLSAAVDPHNNLLALADESGVISILKITDNEMIVKLKSDRIYENMKITNTTGLTSIQKENLKVLGASE